MGNNQSVLSRAVTSKDYQTISTILKEENVAKDAVDQVLEHGCESGDDRLVEIALQNYKEGVGLISEKKYLLNKASFKGHLEIVNLLLESGAKVNLQGEKEFPALVSASENGHTEVVKALIKNGALVNIQVKEMWTALMVASFRGHVDVVKVLLENRADVNLQQNNGWSALMIASYHCHTELIKLLLENGAYVDIQSNGFLCSILATDYRETFQLIYQNYKQRLDCRLSALMIASLYGHAEVVKMLLENGANVDLQDDDGWSALMIASESGHAEIVMMLLEKGAAVNLQSKIGWSALMLASKNGHAVVVRKLLDSEAQIEYITEDGLSAIKLASQKKHTEVLHILQKSLKEVWSLRTFTSVQISTVKEHVKGRGDNLKATAKELSKRVVELDRKIKRLTESLKESEEKADTEVKCLKEEIMCLKERVKESDKQVQKSDQRAEESKQRALESDQRAQKSDQRAQESDQRAQESGQRAQELRKKVNDYEAEIQQLKMKAERFNRIVNKSNQIPDDLSESARQLIRRAEEAERRAEEAERRAIQLKKEYDEQWAITSEDLNMTGPEIGRGAWATVRVAEFRGVQVAVKEIHGEIVCRRNSDLFRREMLMAAKLHHPNLVQFIGATSQGKLMIVMEFIPISLRKQLEIDEFFSPKIVKYVSLDIARALNYLHLMKPNSMIHRDVSSANVLLEPLLPPKTWKAKITDYGSVNLVRQLNTESPGSPVYSAPEARFADKQSAKMDIYSFGVLILEMLTGRLPTPETRPTLLGQVHHEQLLSLIQRCLTERPEDRPNSSAIISELC